jgi:hypothetical protein
MAFIRAATPRPLWLPPAMPTPLPANRERIPIPSNPTAQGPVGQKASVTFGNLGDIGKVLRAARKARRENMEQQTEAVQPAMFDL